MSKSYIPANTQVVCTQMTKPDPQELLAKRCTQTVIHTKGVLLTIEDKKITNTFICKSPKKFWNGLMMMCAGIAVGALAALVIVGTAGTGAVVVGLAYASIGATFLAAGVGTVGHFIAHDCDPTMEGEWMFVNENVNFNKSKALLQSSILSCPNGGMLTIMMNPTTAMDAGKEYATNNNNEMNAHNQSQFFQGIVSGVTALTPTGIIVGTAFGIFGYEGYYWSEKDQENKQKNKAKEVLNGGDVDIEEEEIIDYIKLPIEITQDISVGVATDIGKDIYKKKSIKEISPKNIIGRDTGIGIAGVIINHILDNMSNNGENNFYKENMNHFNEVKEHSKIQNGINVISKNN